MNKDKPVSLLQFFAILLLIIAIPLAFSQLLIRYVYTQWLEPNSTAGTVMLAATQIEKKYVPGKKNILVVGNSRVGEGFSEQVANAAIDNEKYNFISLGLPGTTPRIWFYVLKKLDPQAVKFHAIYLMAENYRDTAEENYNDREIDTAYLSAILALGDIASYPASFEDPKKVSAAFYSVLFPIMPLQNDLTKFIANPRARIKAVRLWRKDFVTWTAGYNGRDERLPLLENIQQTEAVIAQLPEEKKSVMKWYFDAVKHCDQEYLHSFRYNSRWFGDISASYANRAVRVGVFMIPRGPYHQQMGCNSTLNGSLKLLEEKNRLTLVPADLTLDLEQPEYFFDHLHVNAAGRKIFSARLATAIVNQMED